MKNTIENNRLIAQFMGGKFISPDSTNYEIVQFPKDVFYSFRSTSPDPNLPFSIPVSYARFNVSWNWLMPVVEKCITINVSTDPINYYFVINDALIQVNIESLYKAVVSFINWYNQQPK